MAKCRGCGEPILFIRMKNRKMIPVNPSPVFVEDKSARDVIITADGRVSNGRQEYVKSDNDLFVKGYISHFATCPFASQFRNRDKAENRI